MLANLRPRGVGETLDAAVALYRARFGTLLRITALVVIPIQLINVVIAVSSTPSSGTTLNSDSGTLVWTPLAGNIASTIVNTFAVTIATAAIVGIVADTYLGSANAGAGTTRLALRRAGAVLWLAVLYSVVVSVGLLLCFVPGVWLGVAWSVSMPALLIEGKRARPALRRSFQLTKGNWWRCAGVYWGSQVLTLFITYVLQAVVAALLHSYVHGTNALVFEQAVARCIAAPLTTPFFAAAIIVMYFDLRIRSEGFDIQMAVRDLDRGRSVAPAQAG